MRSPFLVISFFVFVYFLFGIYLLLTYKPVTMNEIKGCEVDEDCVQVRAGCCGCEAGGENTCINKNYVEAWENSLNSRCKGVACITLYNCVPSSCECINNTCVLRIK